MHQGRIVNLANPAIEEFLNCDNSDSNLMLCRVSGDNGGDCTESVKRNPYPEYIETQKATSTSNKKDRLLSHHLRFVRRELTP